MKSTLYSSLSIVALGAVLAPSAASQTCSARWAKAFCYNSGGWRVDLHPRMMADVNGDRRADIVGFANEGVYVARSNGRGFESETRWVAEYGLKAGGWRVDEHPRMMADVNGDGMQDVIGFADEGVYVSLSNGVSFSTGTRWVSEFGMDDGWRVNRHPRMMADVNGDGRQDVVGFANDGVYVAVSNGSSFSKATRWIASFGYIAGEWRVGRHPRILADADRDGREDIIGFADDGVWVSLSNGKSFLPPTKQINEFGYSAGWRAASTPRMVADVNGDDLQDIVGFASRGVFVSLALGGGRYSAPRYWIHEFGYHSSAGGWRVDSHPRFLADINGDGRADVIGIGGSAVTRALSTGSGFHPAKSFCASFGGTTGNWDVAKHPRMIADVNGDQRMDLVGFHDDYVRISTDQFTNTFGAHCGSGITASFNFLGTMTSQLDVFARGPKGSPLAALIFGFDKGRIPLPGCEALILPVVTVPLALRPSGTGRFSALIPMGQAPSIHCQFLAINPTSTHVTASAGLTLVID